MTTTLHNETPTFHSTALSHKHSFGVHLKMECYQPVGSFKLRGIGKLVAELAASGIDEFVCSSGGNAGIACAYACRVMKKRATIFVPSTTSDTTIAKLRQEQATVTDLDVRLSSCFLLFLSKCIDVCCRCMWPATFGTKLTHARCKKRRGLALRLFTRSTIRSSGADTRR